MHNREGKDQTNSRRFYNRTKSITIVQSGALKKTFCDKARLIFIKRPIRYPFNAKDPFATNNTLRGVTRHKSPCAIVNKGVILITHGVTPVLILHGLGGSGWFSMEVVECSGSMVSDFTSGKHRVEGLGAWRGWYDGLSGRERWCSGIFECCGER